MAGWSRVIGANLFNELRGSFNTVRSDVIHPAFGIDANPQYGIKGVPNDPRFYGGLPHMPIARVQRIGGPFFRPQFQDSQVFQLANNLTWQKGSHAMKFGAEFRRDNLNYIDLRSLNGELSFIGWPLHGLRLRRFPAGARQRAAADAVPRTRSLRERLAVLRARQLARAIKPDHHGRRPLRNVHAAAGSQQPAD